MKIHIIYQAHSLHLSQIGLIFTNVTNYLINMIIQVVLHEISVLCLFNVRTLICLVAIL